MPRFLIIALISLVGLLARAQVNTFSPPEYHKMRESIFDNTSPHFYPILFKKYQQGDTSLTLEDFRFLYYGYTLQNMYKPYYQSKYQEQMISYLRKGTLSTRELNEFIKLAEQNLNELPFDIRTLNILAFSYRQAGDSMAMTRAGFRKNMIIAAIKSSGNGLSERTAFHVIDVSHEFDFLHEMGLHYTGSSNMTTGLYDYLLVQPNDAGIRGYYFNISRLMQVKTERSQ
jgi:hypothetical protein